ncbi:MAG: tRNA ((46)-N7)-methyltransferase TrmB [Clostridia bacterium]|jgi:tRNA (guanine-N7-)-methyltransferase|nr:tRNA ((46)-N7)-methyltransferase TrmB [Clostridia bacterium]
MRMRHKPYAVDKLLGHPDIVIFKPALLKGKWSEEFGNSNPINVELGMGRGQFITTNAYKHPNNNYIGIEKKNEVVLSALQRVLDFDHPIQNLRMLPTNIDFISELFGAQEIDRLYINFCDPWPKDRHAKRRLTHRGYLNEYKELLKPKADIIFKTDNRELFDFSIEEFQACGYEITEITYDLHKLEDPENVMTEYEKKFSEMGVKINRLKAYTP